MVVRWGSRRGSELVEGMMALLPFLALVFLIIDTSWGIFLQATLQNAVQMAASAAASDSSTSLSALIQSTVQGQLPSATVSESYYTPTNLTTPLAPGAVGSSAAGNVIEVDAHYTFAPLAPLFRSGATIPLSATASAVLAAYPAAPL
jgi:Flp pilus assembly protein TadG